MSRSQATLLSDDLWHHITRLARRSRCHVAVAYVGAAAPKLLPLKEGSILVCDFSRATVERGLVDPDAIQHYLDHGVEIHSKPNLHAKVFCFGDVAFVGSCNVSANSSYNLIEAAVRITDPTAVNEASNFILGLRGARVTPELVAKLRQFYQKPSWESSDNTNSISHLQLWVARFSRDASDKAYTMERKTRGKALASMKNPAGFDLTWFEWASSPPIDIRKHSGEIILIDGRSSECEVYPPARYVIDEPIIGKGGRLIRLEAPRDLKPKPIRNLPAAARTALESIKQSGLIKDPALAQQLRQLWYT